MAGTRSVGVVAWDVGESGHQSKTGGGHPHPRFLYDPSGNFSKNHRYPVAHANLWKALRLHLLPCLLPVHIPGRQGEAGIDKAEDADGGESLARKASPISLQSDFPAITCFK